MLTAIRLVAAPSAADHPVGDDASLRAAILAAADGDTITFTADITLVDDLPAVQSDITIVGGGHTLSGGDTYRAFFIGQWGPGTATQMPVTVTIENLIIEHTRAHGGNGGWGDDGMSGGGGAALGGAIFVANLAQLTIENVTLQSNTAEGGAGGVFSGQPGVAAGGGGMGGDGGHATWSFPAAGAGAGGGLGRKATGGKGNTGGAGLPGIATGALPGGNGASGHLGGAAGGGGGSASDSSYNAAAGGGVGGANGVAPGTGGDGGFGGGGGGQGGNGGYGGGGGGNGGDGGFGGGGGAGVGGTTGGFAGGAGGATAAGGGAALGGALFVQDGGTLIVQGNLTIDGNTLETGPAVFDGVNGSTFGSGLFVAGDGTLHFQPAAGQTQTIANDIADQSGSGGTGADAGVVALSKTGAGTLVLGGTNTYAGATTVTGGTLTVNGTTSASSAVHIVSGATLSGSGTVGGSVLIDGGSFLSPTGVLHTGSLTIAPSGRLTFRLQGATPGSYDQVAVTGSVSIDGAVLTGSLDFPATAGTVFTLIDNDGSDLVSGQFVGIPNGATVLLNGGREGRVDYGNDVTLTVLQATPGLSATPSAGVTFGGSINAAATLTGGFTPTGTVTFTAYGPDNGCSGAPVFTDTKALSVGTATSASFTPAAAGVYRWIASYSGDVNNAAAATSCGQAVTVTKANQTITFTLPATKLVDDPAFPVSASSDSLLGVTLTPQTTAVCTIAGGMLTLLDVGTCTVTATQTGNGNYNAATPVSRSITVSANCATRALQPTHLLTALGGVPYTHTFTVANGAGTSAFTLDGALPAGLTFANGVISGTSSVRGVFPITVGATDAQACHVAGSFTLAVSAERRLIAGTGDGASTVRAFTLAGTTPVAQFEAFGPGFPGGVSVAQGDTNGDGTPDVIAGAGPGGGPAVRVFDGTTGAQIASFFAFGVSYLGGVDVAAGDITGDGIPEVLAAPSGCGGELVVRAFNAQTGALVREYPVPAPWSCGLHVAAGDVNGDGLADLVTGAGYLGAPLVTVLDGYSGATIRQFAAYVAGFGGGVYVAAGDITGDGFADVVTGAAAGGGPHVRAFNGVTGAEIAGPLGSFFAYHPAFPGGVRVAAGDLNGDGRAELITAAGPGGGPHVRVFNGATGTEILGLFAFNPAFPGGAFVAAPPSAGRMRIDVPTGTSGTSVRVAGWALKQLGIDTVGTDAIHVWALPVGGGAPVFVGSATSRVARPDIAAAFGGEFLQSGYDITGTLAPGVYDLVVFARNSRTILFDQMRILRVTIN